jgi:hypothetical protein
MSLDLHVEFLTFGNRRQCLIAVDGCPSLVKEGENEKRTKQTRQSYDDPNLGLRYCSLESILQAIP